MNVKELIERLSQCNPAAIVIVASDAEGNGHSPLCDLIEAEYFAQTSYSGIVPGFGLSALIASPPGTPEKAVILQPLN